MAPASDSPSVAPVTSSSSLRTSTSRTTPHTRRSASRHTCACSQCSIYMLVFVFINPCIFPYVYIYVPNSRRVTTWVRIFTYRKYNGTMGWSHISALFVWHPFCCKFLSIFEKPQFVVVWSAFWCTFLCNGDCSW